MNDVIISVRGESESKTAPERGVVHLSVTADGPDREAVVDRVASVATPLREDLVARAADGTVAEWTNQRVSVWSDRPWNNEGRQLDLVHHASAELTATFTDFALLSDWVNTIGDRPEVQVGAVEWLLSPATRRRVEREVATAAVSVAIERAQAYAAAIGRAEVEPLQIADVGLLDGDAESSASPRLFAKAAAMDAMASTGGGAAAFHPDDIVITAAVEARFRAF